jgi:hypothetical protein
MAERRVALLIACDEYRDAQLRKLHAPSNDIKALSDVLQDPEIGAFEVATLLNEASYKVNEAIENFFSERARDDLLLLYFSGHGVKNDDGNLYFAASNTHCERLNTTATSARFVSEMMSESRSQRIALLLDCCYSGAFAKNWTPKSPSVGIRDSFEQGRGRVVLTATDSIQFAFENPVASGEVQSLFARHIVTGLRSGQVDRDGDGRVTLDELYDYVRERIRAEAPKQRPKKWAFDVEGKIYIAGVGSAARQARRSLGPSLPTQTIFSRCSEAGCEEATPERRTSDRNKKNMTIASATTGVGRQPLLTEIRWVWPVEATTVLLEPTILLGRDDDCKPPLESAEVSRQHAKISLERDSYVIEDQSSTNGVFVNGQLAERHSLALRDVIRLGDFVGVLAAWSGATPRPPKCDGDPALLDADSMLWGVLEEGLVATHARQIAENSETRCVVIEGEIGTGKEAVARAMHAWSGRTGAFCRVQCEILGPLADALIFGFEKNAFHGGDLQAKEVSFVGYLRAAQHGTLYLDDVTSLDAKTQQKLLETMESRSASAVGSGQRYPLSTKFIAATRKPLREAVASGTFRSDLRAHLEEATLKLPCLRDRQKEIPKLFRALLRLAFSGQTPPVDPKVVETLCLQSWPGNIRQLRALADGLVARVARAQVIKRRHLRDLLESTATEALERGERIFRLSQCLWGANVKGDIRKAAASCGTTTAELRRWLQESLGKEGAHAFEQLATSLEARTTSCEQHRILEWS